MKGPSISESEWRILQTLWERHPMTAGDVVERLGAKHGWHERTIKTMLHRLVRKKALVFRREGKRYLYSPRLSREKCIREASRSFLDRVFAGAVTPALVHLVEEARLTPAEIDRLRAILDRKSGGAK